MKQPVVGFAGMTHLGLVSAASVAGRGFDVVCFDADAAADPPPGAAGLAGARARSSTN